MIKCDKVYIPKQDGPYVINTSWGQFDTEFADSAFNVIVLTIEELREMWGTAMERRDRDNYARDIGKDDYNTAPTFEEYLKECGIKLNQ